MANMDIRLYARGNGVQHWRIAQALGISEPTLTRRLRKELAADEKQRFRELIEQLAADMAAEQAGVTV